jgi:hypothetical protein
MNTVRRPDPNGLLAVRARARVARELRVMRVDSSISPLPKQAFEDAPKNFPSPVANRYR